MTSVRESILQTYSEWTALSALRSKGPIKSRDDVYPLLRGLDFQTVVDVKKGPIQEQEFEEWHQKTLQNLMDREDRLQNQFGWAAKIVNVYLKTYAYIGDGGRPNLRFLLHPPIDGGLWNGVKHRFAGRRDILQYTHCVTSIGGINTHQLYTQIIRGLKVVAVELTAL